MKKRHIFRSVVIILIVTLGAVILRGFQVRAPKRIIDSTELREQIAEQRPKPRSVSVSKKRKPLSLVNMVSGLGHKSYTLRIFALQVSKVSGVAEVYEIPSILTPLALQHHNFCAAEFEDIGPPPLSAKLIDFPHFHHDCITLGCIVVPPLPLSGYPSSIIGPIQDPFSDNFNHVGSFEAFYSWLSMIR